MTDKLDITENIKKELKLKQIVEQIDWLVFHGSVKIQIRYGKPTLIILERTVKLD